MRSCARLLIVFSFGWSFAGAAPTPAFGRAPQTPDRRAGTQTANGARGSDRAAPECLSTADELLRYLLDTRTKIETDSAGQQKWLSSTLQGELTVAMKRTDEE